MDHSKKLIITAASKAFGPSLLALLGSLNLNWPKHPPVLVYDIGLDEDTLRFLKSINIDVIRVPPFVPHWRKHFTWKIWCWNDAPAQDVLWLDAGLVVLRPLDDMFEALNYLGYFITPSYFLLTDCATEAACHGCGVSSDFRNDKMTFNGGVIGFNKHGMISDILKEALDVAYVEENIIATQPLARHDQAIISLLLYKYLKTPLVFDGMIYAGWESPRQVHLQRIWQHRRNISSEDIEYYKQHISVSGAPYIPFGPPLHQKRKLATTIKNLFSKSLSLRLYSVAARLSKKKRETHFYDGVID